MASYGVFVAACGFEYHGPKGYIAFSPRLTPDHFKAAFTSAEGWGSFTQTRAGRRQTELLEVKYGKLRLKTLAFDLPAGAKANKVSVKQGGAAVAARFTQQKNRIVITLAKPVAAKAGEALIVEISHK